EVPLGAAQIGQRRVRRQGLHDGRELLQQTEQGRQGGLVRRRQLETYAENGHPALPGLWCHNFLPTACPSPAGRRSAQGCISYPVGMRIVRSSLSCRFSPCSRPSLSSIGSRAAEPAGAGRPSEPASRLRAGPPPSSGPVPVPP